MNESLSHNKISFYNSKEPPTMFSFWISLILSISFFLSCTISIRLSTPYTAVYNESTNTLTIFCSLEEIDKISEYEILRLEKKNYSFQIQNWGDLYLDEKTNQNVQKIELKSPKSFQNNQVLKIYLLDSKEKIIKKIQKLIQGG